MKIILKILLTLLCAAFLTTVVIITNAWIGRGAERNLFALALYLVCGLACAVTAVLYLKRKESDVGGSVASWLIIIAPIGIGSVLLWPLLLPILIWSETVLTRMLKKHYFPSAPELEGRAGRLSHQEKIDFLKQLSNDTRNPTR